MQIETTGKILSAESKPYSVDGNEGVSHRIRVNVDGEIYSCKSSAEQVALFQSHIKQEGQVTFLLKSRKEALSLELELFKPE